ncbi:MAG: tetratricopeptide repeat protein [Christensenellales bacterium]|jgi:tetratricopeptide (TPR) repeat protein
MENKKLQPNSRILKFEQPSEYFNRRALRQLGKSDLWGALGSLRLALEKDTKSASYRMSVAEVLAQMGLYELSSDMLFHVLVTKTGDDAQCFFALASNFFALRMASLSHDCIANYLRLEPNGEFAPDCEEMLFILEQEMGEAELAPVAMRSAEDGKRALDEGDYLEAIQKLSSALEIDPGIAYARNNLALAYFCVQDTEKAVTEAEKSLEKDEGDVFALCNMAIFMNSKGDVEKASQYLERAAEQPNLGDDELYKLCITSADLQLHSKAVGYSQEILKFSPYDENVLFLQALAQYNSGNYSSAYRAISRLLLLEPQSAVYQHVMQRISAALSDPEKAHGPLEYAFSLPAGEAVSRFDEIRKFMALPRDEAAQRLENDERTYVNLLWCFSLEDSDIKYDLALHLASMGCEKGILIILMMLVSLEQTDDFKKTLVMALYAQDIAKPPYHAVLGDNIAEIRLKKALSRDSRIPVGYERVIHQVLADEMMRNHDEVTGLALQLWVAYMVTFEGKRIPPIRNEHSWVASVIYAALKLKGKKADAKKIAQRFKTREFLVLRRYEMFKKIYEQVSKEHEYI